MATEPSLSLRQGTTENLSPPFALKVSPTPSAISSSVSTQSAAKPGVMIASSLTPFLASSSTVTSV